MLRTARIHLGVAATAVALLAGGTAAAVPTAASAAAPLGPAPAGTVQPQLTVYTFINLYSDPNGLKKCNEAGQDLVFSGQYDRYRCTPFSGIPRTFELDGGTDI